MNGICPAHPVVSEYYGPSGFHWLIPGVLGGAQMPGIRNDVDQDLEALQRVGTQLLVTLTEEWEPDPERFARFGIANLFVPIPARRAPTLNQAQEICGAVNDHISRGQAVVHHCRAGKGRTGTLLAAQLVYSGLGAREAIEFVRK